MLFSMAVSEAVPLLAEAVFLLPGQIISACPGVKRLPLPAGARAGWRGAKK
ncbi:hypothetical protein [Rhizobium grahamii]|uniref:hypothetical protein n=1 Tax=Rhizobium grahamii TaxID=1120045 RepID=UPI000309BAC4|nr:hypothetical protein [Rhizobium grahamii]